MIKTNPKKRAYRILMIIPKYEPINNLKNYHYSFPMGIPYIAASLKKAGYALGYLNLNHYDGKVEDIIKRELDKDKYDFVATGNNALGYEITKVILNAVKNHPSQPKTILGGPIITSEPEIIFEDLKPDFGVIGEGEETIVDLLLALEKGKDLKKIKNIIYSKEGKSIITERGNPPMNPDALPFPDIENFGFAEWLEHANCNTVPSHGTFDYPRTYLLVASRSCPFQCTFCYHDNNFYRTRSIDNIIEELRETISKYKINRIVIQDELFALDKERLEEFCIKMKKLLKEFGWKIRWFTQMRVNKVDNKSLKMMKEAGCDIVGYGFESFSNVILKSMKKQIKGEQIEKAFYETLKVGIGIEANFIFGDVAETKETAYETLNWWKKNAKGQIYLDFIQPYPDSEMYRIAIKKGIIKDRLQFIKDLGKRGNLVWNMTDNMSNKEIWKLNKDILKALSKYRKFVVPLAIKKETGNIYSLNIKCPFCHHNYEMKNCKISNKLFFGFSTTCRNCNLIFYITSNLKRIAYKNFHRTKRINRIFKKAINVFK